MVRFSDPEKNVLQWWKEVGSDCSDSESVSENDYEHSDHNTDTELSNEDSDSLENVDNYEDHADVENFSNKKVYHEKNKFK